MEQEYQHIQAINATRIANDQNPGLLEERFDLLLYYLDWAVFLSTHALDNEITSGVTNGFRSNQKSKN